MMMKSLNWPYVGVLPLALATESLVRLMDVGPHSTMVFHVVKASNPEIKSVWLSILNCIHAEDARTRA